MEEFHNHIYSDLTVAPNVWLDWARTLNFYFFIQAYTDASDVRGKTYPFF